MFLRFGNVFAEGIVVDSECEGRASGAESDAEVYISGLRTGEEEEVCYA